MRPVSGESPRPERSQCRVARQCVWLRVKTRRAKTAKYRAFFSKTRAAVTYNFEHADTEVLQSGFPTAKAARGSLARQAVPLPPESAEASHIFNLIDPGVISPPPHGAPKFIPASATREGRSRGVGNSQTRMTRRKMEGDDMNSPQT